MQQLTENFSGLVGNMVRMNGPADDLQRSNGLRALSLPRYTLEHGPRILGRQASYSANPHQLANLGHRRLLLLELPDLDPSFKITLASGSQLT